MQLETGKYYSFIRKEFGDNFHDRYFIGIKGHKENFFSTYIYIDTEFYNCNGWTYEDKESILEIRPSTKLEIEWLNECIKNNKFISKPKETINNSYSIY